MAYLETINLVKGDDLPALEIILRDSNIAAAGKTLDLGDSTTWVAMNLSDVNVVKLKVRKVGLETLVDTINFTRIQPYSGGKIVMDWGSTSLDSGFGDYEGEIEITYTNNKVLTVPDLFKFNVREQF